MWTQAEWDSLRGKAEPQWPLLAPGGPAGATAKGMWVRQGRTSWWQVRGDLEGGRRTRETRSQPDNRVGSLLNSSLSLTSEQSFRVPRAPRSQQPCLGSSVLSPGPGASRRRQVAKPQAASLHFPGDGAARQGGAEQGARRTMEPTPRRFQGRLVPDPG